MSHTMQPIATETTQTTEHATTAAQVLADQERRGERHGQPAPATGAASPRDVGPVYKPAVDVCDCGAEVRIVSDVPGSRADAIDVSFEDGVLSIQAAVPARSLPGRLLRQEYGIGDYRRSFRLGDGFDASQISAELSHGVLTVRVPRLAAVRPRKVEVRVG